jgi:tRNA pseudouridine55 synthase
MTQTKKKKQAISGWLNLYKPIGLASMQATAKARWLLNAAKAGHAGTLDPLAEGILPIAFGEATKLIPLLHDAGKTYRFVVQWGVQTNTDDSEGEVIATHDHRPTRTQIESALPQFIGDITQVPPAYSAIKIDGKRSYARARAGEVVDMPSRTIRIDDFRLVAMGRDEIDAVLASPASHVSLHNRIEGREEAPEAKDVCAASDLALFEVSCGTGTYVRALARDLALSLGTVGHCTRIIRTQVGPFTTENAILLDSLGEMPYESCLAILWKLSQGLDDIPALSLTEAESAKLQSGQPVRFISRMDVGRLPQHPVEGPVLAMCLDRVVAICRLDGVTLTPLRVINA